jgi:hypothetical protein
MKLDIDDDGRLDRLLCELKVIGVTDRYAVDAPSRT